MQVASISSSTDAKVTFRDIGTGDEMEVSTSSNAGTLYLDGKSVTFIANYTESPRFINITQLTDNTDATDTSVSGKASLYTDKEARIFFHACGANNYTGDGLIERYNQVNINLNLSGIGCEGKMVVVEDEDGQEDSSTTHDHVNVSIRDADTGTTDSNKITLNTPVSKSTMYSSTGWDSKDNFETGYTKWGTYVEYDTSGDQDTVTLTYPSEESRAIIYVTSGVTSTSSSGTSEGGATTQKVYKIDVGAAKLASEVDGNEKSNNMILVGGPAINNAAYVWLGKPADPTTGFEVGKAKIKLMEDATTGKVAMLVAGWSAMDTRAAAQFVAKYADKQTTFAAADDEIVLTVTSLTDVTPSIPSAE
jgi:hypothetical protein